MAETLLDEPVKTKLLKAIQACIEGVAGVSQVIRNPSKPVDRDTAVFPLVFIFDESESVVNRNRIDTVTMPIQIQIWVQIHEGILGDQADILEAEIYKALWRNADVKYYSMRMFPETGNTATKFFQDEFSGGIVLRYTAIYSYKFQDPYILVKEARGGS